MHKWAIYRENEDTGEQVYIGDIQADTMAEALQLASEYFEIDSGELVAVLAD
jgi:hypothetical protein